jgi:hypothetical protein
MAEWVDKPPDSPLTISAAIHDAAMAPEERRDRDKVNAAVREGLYLGRHVPRGSADRG